MGQNSYPKMGEWESLNGYGNEGAFHPPLHQVVSSDLRR